MIAPGENAAARAIRARLAQAGRITFREFMERALYEPGGGVYTRPDATTGREGDFSTSSDVSPDFGGRLAVQVAELAERCAGPWRLVELGPGRGLLAGDMLDGLARHAPEVRERLAELVLVERSPALARRQRERLEARGDAVVMRWVGGVDEIEAGGRGEDSLGGPDAPGASGASGASGEPSAAAGRGGSLGIAAGEGASLPTVVVANEVLDALPVHAITRVGEGLRELWVRATPEGRLELEPGPLTNPRLEELALRYGLCAEVGWRAEIALSLEDMIAGIARLPLLGALLVDYGHRARELAAEDHADGTLVAYRKHRLVEDPLETPGECDITAHVNWSHVADAARLCGLDVAGPVSQERFLVALGLVEDLARLDNGPGAEDREALARRLAARALILPGSGGGQRFQVMALTPERAPDLRGLRPPLPPTPTRGQAT